MRNDSVKSPDGEKTHSIQPEIDYTPKTYTLSEKIVLGVKSVLAAGIIFLMFWLSQYLLTLQ